MLEDGHRDDAHDLLVRAHIGFHYLSPVAVLVLLGYLVATVLTDLSSLTILVARVGFFVFFGSEVLVDFLLYEDKVEFFKQYWLQVLLVIPVVGVLRIVGQLARLGQLFKLVKLVEKTRDSLERFSFEVNEEDGSEDELDEESDSTLS